MLGPADVNGAVPVTRQVSGPQETGRYARSEQLAIPGPMIIGDRRFPSGYEQRFVARPDAPASILSPPERSGVAIRFIEIRIPVATAHPLDKFGADPVAFDRQGMIGIQNIRIRNLFQITLNVLGNPAASGNTSSQARAWPATSGECG